MPKRRSYRACLRDGFRPAADRILLPGSSDDCFTNASARCERIGEHLANCGVAPDRVEHSDKLRARQTAEILASGETPSRTRDRAGTQR